MDQWLLLDLIGATANTPEFHLALEESILESSPEQPLLLMYENPNAVVLGKNQNPWQELNLDYLDKYQIPIYRRISGGGTVFHGPGNLIFSFVEPSKNGLINPMSDYNRVLISALKKLGLSLKEDSRNCLFLDAKKISGNAQALKKGICLSHGTILVQADLGFLEPSIHPEERIAGSKAVSSVRNVVGNLAPDISTDEVLPFSKRIAEEVRKELKAKRIGQEELELDDRFFQRSLEKHRSWDWVFGKTPYFEKKISEISPFSGNGLLKVSGGRLQYARWENLEMEIEKGPAYRSKEFFDLLNDLIQKAN